MAHEIVPKYRDSTKLKNHGSISHHHGVGKLRKKWYLDTVSEPGHRLLLAAKQALDPDNIFALGNIAFEEGQSSQSNNEDTAVKSKL